MTLEEFVTGWYELLDELAQFVTGLLRHRGRPTHYAEDILQQAFVTSLKRVKLAAIDPLRFRQFVFACVRNQFYDWLRKEIRREGHEREYGRQLVQTTQPTQLVDQLAAEETARKLEQLARKAMRDAKLSKLELRAILASLDIDVGRQQAAENAGVSLDTYDQAKHRALKKVARVWAEIAGVINQISYDLFVSLLRELDRENG